MSAFPNLPEPKPLAIADAAWLHDIHKQAFGTKKCWSVELIGQSLALPTTSGFGLQLDPLNQSAFILLGCVADEAEILTLAVTPNHQRKGVASHLMQHSLKILEAKKVKKVFLEVAIDNLPAISLYKKFHFQNQSIRKNYYQYDDHFVDAQIMTHILPSG